MGLIELLVFILIAILILWAANYLIGMMTLPQPAKMIVLIIISLVMLLWFLNKFGIFTGF